MKWTELLPPKVQSRLEGWLSQDEAALVEFRERIASRARARAVAEPLAPPIRELAQLIDAEPLLRMGLTRAIDEALGQGKRLGYTTLDELLRLLHEVMTYSPPFNSSSLMGCPMGALLDWPMCMPSGFAPLRMERFNAQLARVLECWGQFLSGPASREYLNTSPPEGWFSAEADEYLGMSQYQCDPSQPHWGFSSWNDFFARRFKRGQRPVAAPDDPQVIVSACESTPYNLQQDVKLQDCFWLKGQPYSLQDMFTASRAPLARRFEGGTVYQAGLRPYHYHRWHAPVGGTIHSAYNIPGTYFSTVESAGPEPSVPAKAQGYLTSVATRAVVVIDTGRERLGLVACIFVGMGEVSSCKLGVTLGQSVNKGDELGYFQFGGSTHCLVFQPGALRSFVPQPPYSSSPSSLIQVNSPLATAN